MDDLIDRIGGLSTERRALLELRLKKHHLEISGEQIIPRREKRDSTPLSFAQQRLWFLDQYEPNSSVYNIPSAFGLKGSLNIGVLEQSLNEIIRRHEILRTTFSMLDGKPVQVIAPSQSLSLPVLDLTDGPETEREDEARRLAREQARRPFDLSRGPLVRATVIRLSEDDHVLVLTLHHIVSDGWSMGVLYRELSVLYEAFRDGKRSPLSDLPIQYADYAVWQRQWLQGEVLGSQLSYWKKQLGGIPAVLNLPTDRPRPVVQSFRGKTQSIELSRELTQGLKALSRKEGVTLFMTLLAAFQSLLCRYTGQEDVVVGSPIANRNRTEIEGLIGFFVNTLVLRSNFSGNPTFKELLAQVREMALGAYAHQDLPFEKLVEELQPQRSLSHSPLFQVMFVLQNARGTAAKKFEGLRANPVPIGAETAKFDLTLSMSETEEGLRGSLQYSTDLFDAATIARMSGHLQTLLEGIDANPDQRISQLPILTQAEQDQLLIEWNDTQRDYPKDKCIHELFEAQVEKSPDAVAVTFGDQQLTYRELNKRANQLAHYLRKRGVGPDVLVAICVERSLEIVVGLLGILKAGGAYVPLDPEYPQERLTFMVEDAQPAVLLTQARVAEKLSNPKFPLLCLDRDWEQISKETEENTENKARADNIAYVIYTSGTTGQPKGVMTSHHNIGRLFGATEAWFHFRNNDVWTMFHSYAFDFSVWEMWGALLYGGRVVIVPFWVSRSPEKFYELLCREGVTVLNQTPSAFRQLIQVDQSLSNRPAMALRWIIFGGEALDFQSLQPWVDRHGDQYPQLVNMYGITETTVHVTYRVVRATDVKQGLGSLIGVPLPDLDLYVLDEHRQLVPVGIPGELYVSGAGVGRGYLNRPELTDERFVLNPFNGRKTEKLYKTGDLVRRLSTGDIEYLGRTDAQIKLRGYRIELGEIESVLGQHPAVQEAVVLAQDDATEEHHTAQNRKSKIENLKSDKRLVAYVVPSQKAAAPTLSELRSFLKQKLPDYMVPSAFVFLDALPLSSNGKVDRKALPAPDQSRSELESTFVAPRTPAEKLLAGIWIGVLKVGRVGVHDNFFELGGHSLLATRLVSQIQRELNVELPLRVIFEKATIESLALHLLEQQAKATHPDEIYELLAELDSISDESAESQLLDLKEQPQGTVTNKQLPTRPLATSRFHCPRVKSEFFGKRECNLIVLLNERFETASFEKIAGIVRELDPTIHAVVVRDAAGMDIALRQRPTLTFSPALIRHRPAQSGRVFCGYPLSKSEECTALAKAGIAVPKWVLLTEDDTPDLSGFDDYVVRKPNYGGMSAEVRIVRRDRVKWKPITTRPAGTSLSMIVQQFVYTGVLPISYRVNTLFGRVLYSTKSRASPEHPPLFTPADLKSLVTQRGFTVSAAAHGGRSELCFDEEIIRLGERAHTAFPDIPLLGFDIVREMPSGKLYVLEANAIGYVWNFNSHQVANYGFSFEEQFDGVSKAAYILTEKTQQCAE